MIYKFAHITDLHLSDKDAANHQPGVQEELWAMLEEVADICLAEDRNLFVTGDIFDQPRASWVSHGLVNRLINYFARWENAGLSVIGVAGNHDLSHEGLASLDKQPIGVVASSGYLQLPSKVSFISSDIGMIQITPLHYTEEAEYSPRFYDSVRDSGADFHIVLAHGALRPDSKDYPYPTVGYSDVQREGVDLFLFGHMHDDYGVETIDSTTFVSCGSFSRRSRVQKRAAYIALGEITATECSVRKHKLKAARPWQQLFTDIPEIASAAISPEMENLARDARNLLTFDEVDYREVLESFKDTVSKGVLTRAVEFVDQAEHTIRG